MRSPSDIAQPPVASLIEGHVTDIVISQELDTAIMTPPWTRGIKNSLCLYGC